MRSIILFCSILTAECGFWERLRGGNSKESDVTIPETTTSTWTTTDPADYFTEQTTTELVATSTLPESIIIPTTIKPVRKPTLLERITGRSIEHQEPLSPRGIGPPSDPMCPLHWQANDCGGIAVNCGGICHLERTWYPHGMTQRIAVHSCLGFQRNKAFRAIDKTQPSLSELFVPKNPYENHLMKLNTGKLRRPYTDKEPDCGFSWIGIHRNQDGVWISSTSGNPIGWGNWRNVGEHNKVGHNYAIMDSEGFWYASKNVPHEATSCKYHDRPYYNVLCVMPFQIYYGK